MMNRTAALALPLAAMLGLAACSQADEKTYEADATDQSGGELIVTDEAAQPDAMPEAETTPDE